MSKSTHPYFKRRVLELVELGFSPSDILKIFATETPDDLADQIPSLRTIQRMVKEKSKDNRQEWKITDCENPEDAQFVLDALYWMILRTPFAEIPKISVTLADMVIRVKKAAPSLRGDIVLRLALWYLAGISIDDIHLLLAAKPFDEGGYGYKAYVARLKNVYGNDWKKHAIYTLTRENDRVIPVWDFDPESEPIWQVLEE